MSAFLFSSIRPFSRAVNFASGGTLAETLCSRVARHSLRGDSPLWFWRGMEKVLNAIFFWDPEHCVGAFEKHIERTSK